MNKEILSRVVRSVVVGISGAVAGEFIVPSVLMGLGLVLDGVGLMPEAVDPGDVLLYGMFAGILLGFLGGAIGQWSEES